MGNPKIGVDDFLEEKGPVEFQHVLNQAEPAANPLPGRLGPAEVYAVIAHDAMGIREAAWGPYVPSFNVRTLEVCLGKKPASPEEQAAKLEVTLGKHGHQASYELILRLLVHVARQHSFDPVRNYLRRLPEVGGDAIGDLCTHSLHVPPSDALTRSLMRKFLISAVARALKPGCQVDTVLILVGPQGYRKTRFFVTLAGLDYFSCTAIDLRTKDARLALCGPWFYEWGELESPSRAGTETSKAFVSDSVDRFRPPYGRVTEAFPRRCVIVGSTNDYEFLTDPTGHRRHWPVEVTQPIDLDWLNTHRDEVWAQAVALYRAGESWWIDESSSEAEQLRERHVQHEVEDPLAAQLIMRLRQLEDSLAAGRVKPQEFTTSALSQDLTSEWAKVATARRVGAILRAQGYDRTRDTISHGRRGPWYWRRLPDAPATVTPISGRRGRAKGAYKPNSTTLPATADAAAPTQTSQEIKSRKPRF